MDRELMTDCDRKLVFRDGTEYYGYGFGDFSEDVNAFTLGVRGEVLTKAGSVNIVPHLGLRYTRLSTDSVKAGFNTEIDDQNIFQMHPVFFVHGK